MGELLKVEDLIKSYSTGKNEFKALKGISFTVEEGEFVLLYGDSGSGKSTALNIIGGMDRASSGKVIVYNRDITSYSDKQLNEYRRNYIGFVFQSYNLINNLSARENIMLVSGKDPDVADKMLEEMGLKDRADAFPTELSGGEAQRVALARAMAKSPAMLLCDEPTGALDYDNSRRVMQAIKRLNRESGITVLMVSHNLAFLPIADKVIKLKSGWIESISENDSPISVEELEW